MCSSIKTLKFPFSIIGCGTPFLPVRNHSCIGIKCQLDLWRLPLFCLNSHQVLNLVQAILNLSFLPIKPPNLKAQKRTQAFIRTKISVPFTFLIRGSCLLRFSLRHFSKKSILAEVLFVNSSTKSYSIFNKCFAIWANHLWITPF